MGWKTEDEQILEHQSKDYLDGELCGAFGHLSRLYKSEARARAAMKRRGLTCVSSRVTKPCILADSSNSTVSKLKLEYSIGKLTYCKEPSHQNPASEVVVIFRMPKQT